MQVPSQIVVSPREVTYVTYQRGDNTLEPPQVVHNSGLSLKEYASTVGDSYVAFRLHVSILADMEVEGERVQLKSTAPVEQGKMCYVDAALLTPAALRLIDKDSWARQVEQDGATYGLITRRGGFRLYDEGTMEIVSTH